MTNRKISGLGATAIALDGSELIELVQSGISKQASLNLIKALAGGIGSVGITTVGAGLAVSGSPLTSAGTITLALNNDLAALEGLSGTGLAVRTGADTWAQRSLTGPAAGLTVTNGDGVAGNPTLALANDLAALEALSGTDTIYYRSGADTWSPVVIGSGLNFAGGTLSAPSVFSTIAVAGQSNVVADSGSDTLTLAAGTAMGITTNASTDTITVAVTDAELAAIAGLTSAADSAPYFTGSGTASLMTVTSTGRSLLDDTSVGAMRTTLGLGTMALETATDYLTVASAISGYQPLDSDLTAVAGLSGSGLIARTGSGTAASRTITGPAAGISITNGDGVSGNPTVALSNDLAALEGLSGTNTIYYRSAADTWSPVTVDSSLGFTGGTLSVTTNGSTQKIVVSKSGTTIGTRKQINLTEGPNTTITVSDNAVDDRVDITIAASNNGGANATLAEGDYGDIVATSSGTVLSIDSRAVTFAKMQGIATARLLGRTTASSGDIEELTAASARGLLGLATSDSPQFTGIELGHASDTTISRASAGVIAVEGSNVILASNKLSALSATTSAELAGVISDETGSGKLVFDTSPTFTTSTLHPAGSASAPSLAASGDTNTGVLFPAADTVAVSTGGTERVRIDSSGLAIVGDVIAERESGDEVDVAARGYGVGPVMHGYLANGSKASPTAATSGQLLYGLGSRPHTGTGFTPHSTAAIHMIARENITGSAQGTRMAFLVTPNGSTEAARKEAFSLEADSSAEGPRFRVLAQGTLKERFYFQGNGVGGNNTSMGVLPVAAGAIAQMNFFNNPDPTNAAYIALRASSTTVDLLSAATGTGTALPMTLLTDGTERARIDTGGNVGIAETSPAQKLDIGGGSGGPSIRINGGSSGNGSGANIYFSNAGTVVGTIGNYSVPSGGAFDNTISLTGYYGLQFHTAGSERMRIDTSGNVAIGTTSPDALFHVSNVSAKIRIGVSGGSQHLDISRDSSSGASIYNAAQVAPYGFHVWQTAGTERIRIDADGNFLLGGTAAPASATKSLAIFNGTAPTGSVTDGVVIYSQDVSSSAELRVRDEAGNVTTLSPHNFSLIPEGPSEELAWSYYSERDGKCINVDMLKLARVLERLSGEKIVYIKGE